MLKTNISKHKQVNSPRELGHFTSTTFELVKWPSVYSDALIAFNVSEKILAIQTTRFSPLKDIHVNKEDSPFDAFNLGLHVGDNAEQVVKNRNTLKQFLNHQLSNEDESVKAARIDKSSRTINNRDINSVNCVEIQWLEQVHGNKVVTVSSVDNQPLVADASITRERNIALAIMTADCLPILLTNNQGTEIAAIHGGWRPLVANIVTNTIEQMKSEPREIMAWLGPCIGNRAFEVGSDVMEAFVQLDPVFESAFLQQKSKLKDNISQAEPFLKSPEQQAFIQKGKLEKPLEKPKLTYLADLHKIARLQLASLGIISISDLPECTYQQTNKYYSFRKENLTGRMASIICIR